MKKNIGIIAIILILVMLIEVSPEYTFAKEENEDTTEESMEEPSAFNSTLLKENEVKNDVFDTGNYNRYYRINLEKEGKLSVTFSSAALKNKATIWLYYDSECSIGDSKVISYNKKKKITKGTLTSKYIMKPGTYFIMIQPTDSSVLLGKKEVKYSLSIKVNQEKYEDIEPNTIESDAQKISVKELNKKQKIYNMYLCDKESLKDDCDTFTFNLKTQKAIYLKVSLNKRAKLKIFLKRVEPSGNTKIINTKNQEVECTGKTAIFNYNSKKLLSKGKYLLSVVLLDGNEYDIPYQMSVSTYIPMKGIYVKKNNSKIKLKVGSTAQVKYTISKGSTEPIILKSSKTSVVSVNQSGKLTAKKVGTSKITIASKYTKKVAEIKVSVIPIKVSSVKFDKKSLILNKGMKAKLKTKVTPSKATNKNLVWSSSNKKVAKVDQKGNIVAVGKGKSIIKGTAKDGSKKYALCTVIVKEKKIALSSYSKTLYVGSSFKLKASVTSLKKENVKWHTSNSKVASVTSKGFVYGNSSGTAYIYATISDGTKSKLCKVTIIKKEKPVENHNSNTENSTPNKPETVNHPTPTISAGSSSVKVGSSIVLTASIPGGTWTVSGSGKVRLSSNGNKCTVTGVKEGVVYINYRLNGKSNGISIYVRN